MTKIGVSAIQRIQRWRREARRTSGWAGLLYVIPALLILILFEFWPIFYNLYISFWRWDIGPIRFIGLENYRRLFLEGFITTDYLGRPAVGEVLQSLIVTLNFTVIRTLTTLGVSFVLAYLLFIGVRRGRAALRTAYFLPFITSSVAVTLVFAWIFNERVGLANALLRAIGLPSQTWLQDPLPAMKRVLMGLGVADVTNWPDLLMGPSMAMVVVILYSIWASLGYNIVIYLAGLTSIPNEMIEAARIDGADGWNLLRWVIWPLVSPITFFLLITNTISSLQVFDPIYTLTRNTGMGRGEAGGPLDTTLTITVYIFRNFYERANSVGYAAAVAFLLFFIILGLTIWQFRQFGRSVHYQ